MVTVVAGIVDENTKVSPITERATRRVERRKSIISFSNKEEYKINNFKSPWHIWKREASYR